MASTSPSGWRAGGRQRLRKTQHGAEISGSDEWILFCGGRRTDPLHLISPSHPPPSAARNPNHAVGRRGRARWGCVCVGGHHNENGLDVIPWRLEMEWTAQRLNQHLLVTFANTAQHNGWGFYSLSLGGLVSAKNNKLYSCRNKEPDGHLSPDYMKITCNLASSPVVWM